LDNITVAGIGLVGFLIIFPLMRIRLVSNHILSEYILFKGCKTENKPTKEIHCKTIYL